MQYYGFSSHINICFVCIVIIIIIVLDILFYFHIAHLTTEIKYKIPQSTSFMLCMSYRYFNKSSPLFLSHPIIFCYFGVMVFNAIFNNISVISWRSVLLVEETGVPEGNHRPVASHWQTLSHTVVSNTSRHERGLKSQLTLW